MQRRRRGGGRNVRGSAFSHSPSRTIACSFVLISLSNDVNVDSLLFRIEDREDTYLSRVVNMASCLCIDDRFAILITDNDVRDGSILQLNVSCDWRWRTRQDELASNQHNQARFLAWKATLVLSLLPHHAENIIASGGKITHALFIGLCYFQIEWREVNRENWRWTSSRAGQSLSFFFFDDQVFEWQFDELIRNQKDIFISPHHSFLSMKRSWPRETRELCSRPDSFTSHFTRERLINVLNGHRQINEQNICSTDQHWWWWRGRRRRRWWWWEQFKCLHRSTAELFKRRRKKVSSSANQLAFSFSSPRGQSTKWKCYLNPSN